MNANQVKKTIQETFDYSNRAQDSVCDRVWDKLELTELTETLEFKEICPESYLESRFKEYLNPFGFDDNGEMEVYLGPSQVDYVDEDGAAISFPTLTKKMNKADNYYFDKNDESKLSVMDLLYKPYFYQMTIFCNREKALFRTEVNYWRHVKIHRVMNGEEIDPEIYAKGFISFGASPYEYQNVKAKWEELLGTFGRIYYDTAAYKYCKRNIRITKPDKLNETFDLAFDKVSSGNISIKRMGQANCIIGENVINGKTVQYAFDLGYPINKDLTEKGCFINNNTRLGIFDNAEIEQISPELIIISHWHQDHFKAAFTLKKSVYYGSDAAIWVAPVYIPVKYDESGNRLVAYLLKNDHILFAGKKYNGYKNGTFLVKRVCDGYSDLNRDGLLLQTNSCLLPGDCPADIWPADYGYGAIINYVIIPHHGSENCDLPKAQKRILDTFPCPTNRKKAIICVGHNHNKHPSSAWIDFLKNTLKFNEVLLTQDVTNKNDLSIQDK